MGIDNMFRLQIKPLRYSKLIRIRLPCFFLAVCLRRVQVHLPQLMFTVTSTDGQESNDLLKPLFMGCSTRNAKVVMLCLGSLHRLITLKAIPVSSVPNVIDAMAECISQGVDIQLRVLQILLSLLTNYPSTHGDLLGDVRSFCLNATRLFNLTINP